MRVNSEWGVNVENYINNFKVSRGILDGIKIIYCYLLLTDLYGLIGSRVQKIYFGSVNKSLIFWEIACFDSWMERIKLALSEATVAGDNRDVSIIQVHDGALQMKSSFDDHQEKFKVQTESTTKTRKNW